MSGSKTFRHEQIKQIIRRQELFTHDELRRELQKIPINVSQETISRDLAQLRIVKTVKGFIETVSGEGDTEHLFARMAKEFLQSVRAVQNFVVLRTGPGHANTVAVALDVANWEEIVGTIAGDDTILVVAEDTDRALLLQEKFLEYVNPAS